MIQNNYTIEEILKLENLDDLYPDQVCNSLGQIFESGRENKNADVVRKGLTLARNQKLDQFSDHERMIFDFFVANGWGYLHQLTHVLNSDDFWQFETPEVENEVIHLRKALSFSVSVDDPFLTSQVLTNLANTFNHVGRFVDAIYYWHKALELRTGFGMAIGNLGFGLGHYARIVFDEGHQFLFCQFAYQYLNEASTSKDVYPESQESFKRLADIIEKRYQKENLLNIQDLKNFSLGKSNQEIAYREWCIRHALFLNPLNDFIYENIVGHDCLFLPTMTFAKDEPPVYHSIYNQLKQEFVSARYLYYQSLTEQKVHFSDKKNIQMDTLDYAVYSLATEKLKIAFRVCYSLFDKIGYVLNHYFKIGMSTGDVSFRKIWHRKTDKKNWKLNPLISESKNWPLRGLYWISKDLVENGTEFSKSILPEARQIATIRNFMEHKFFKIVDISETAIVDEGLTYQIERRELEQKVLILMRMARSAIMNLSFALHLEEIKKEKKPVMPVSFIKLEDEFKI